MTTPPSILVEIDNTRLRITPGKESLLGPVLRYPDTHFVPGGAGGYQKVQRSIPLYCLDPEGRLLVLAGLKAVVLETLGRAGHAPMIQDYRRSGPRFQPNEQLLQQVQGSEKDLLHCVLCEPRGLLEVRNDADTAQKIALLCQLFPQARTVIPVATKRQLTAC